MKELYDIDWYNKATPEHQKYFDKYFERAVMLEDWEIVITAKEHTALLDHTFGANRQNGPLEEMCAFTCECCGYGTPVGGKNVYLIDKKTDGIFDKETVGNLIKDIDKGKALCLDMDNEWGKLKKELGVLS